MTIRKKRTSLLFFATAISMAALFIGYDYLKWQAIRSYPAYTVALITEFNGNVREYNNSIQYVYKVNQDLYLKKFRNRSLTSNLKGKFVIVKYCESIPAWSMVVLPSA